MWPSLSLAVSAGVAPGGVAGLAPAAIVPSSSEPAGQARVTIVGTRISEGDAVECPKIRAEDGNIYGVSYLAPSIKIGDRVSVTGFFAVMTHCNGRVLYAEKTLVLGGT